MKLTRLFTARKRIVWKEIIDTVYVIMYDQHSNAPAHLEKMQSWICLKISFWSEIFRILESIAYFCNIYHLILLFVKSLFAICFKIVFHIPLCIVRQPYKGCPLKCFLVEITQNETLRHMRTNNVKRVY